MPGSTWTQKLSGSSVLFVVAFVCFIVGWVTNLQILTTVAYVLFICVALMGIYAVCCTTKFSKGMEPAKDDGALKRFDLGVGLVGPSCEPENTTVVQMPANHRPPSYSPPSHTFTPTQTTVPGYYPGYYLQDNPPPYSAAIKQSPYP